MMGLIVRRMVITMLLGILMGIGVNEISFLFVKTDAGRAPERVELLIPKGTAEKIAGGLASSSIPDNLVFVVGDTLVVKNEDVVDHHLGPLYIPSGTSASASLPFSRRGTSICWRGVSEGKPARRNVWRTSSLDGTLGKCICFS